MNKEDKIRLTIDTPVIGYVVVEVPYAKSSDERTSDDFILDLPNRILWGTDYTRLNLSYVVEKDIEHFVKLNNASDEKHQIWIDSLCIYGIQISGNYIRIQYWFHQDHDETSHRMCDGQVTRYHERGNYLHEKDNMTTVMPEWYSSDVCVYW